MRALAVVLAVLAGLLTAPAAVAAVAADQPQRLKWLALGDSYSSGEGVYGAGAGGDDCARSKFAWARLAGMWVERATDPAVRGVLKRFDKIIGPGVGENAPKIDVDMTFLACSGAETTEAGKAEDLDEQLAQATDTYDVITFSFGGNDSQFGPIITGCLLPVGCDESEQVMTGRVRDEVAPKLDVAYRKIREKLAPGGRVVVLGYPRLFDVPELRLTCMSIPRGDVSMLRRVADVLNGVIERGARAHGFDYVDAAGAFEGRNACGTGIQLPALDTAKWLVKEQLPLEFTPACLAMKWINGISAGVEAGLRHMHSFHPNLCGHLVESMLVAGRVLGWRATGEQPAVPTRVNLQHGGLTVEFGDHETLHYRHGQPVEQLVDHLTRLFGLPGPEDTVAVDPLRCGPATGRMTWLADDAPVLSLMIKDGALVSYTQHRAHPAITTPDAVTTGAFLWELTWRSGGQVLFTDESRRIGGVVATVHRFERLDSVALGDPPRAGYVGDVKDWLSEIVDVQDGPPTPPECEPPAGLDLVPADSYRQNAYGHEFYFFTVDDFICGFDTEAAVCQGETQPLPPDPGCNATWGYGMSVDATGAADYLCAGGLIWAPADGRAPDERDVLPSGKSISAAGFTCTAEEDGVRCAHDASGHGFFVAPDSNEKF